MMGISDMVPPFRPLEWSQAFGVGDAGEAVKLQSEGGHARLDLSAVSRFRAAGRTLRIDFPDGFPAYAD